MVCVRPSFVCMYPRIRVYPLVRVYFCCTQLHMHKMRIYTIWTTSEHTCTYIYEWHIYIYMTYTHIYMYIYIHIHIHIHIHIYMCVCDIQSILWHGHFHSCTNYSEVFSLDAHVLQAWLKVVEETYQDTEYHNCKSHWVNLFACVCVCMCTCVCFCVYVEACAYVCVHAWIQTHAYTCSHESQTSYTYECIHTHIHTHIHTQLPTRPTYYNPFTTCCTPPELRGS